MRAKEFLKEFTINVPVTINIPLSDLLKSSDGERVINPGLRYGEDGDAKWSPPLQQHLDTVKDSVGPSETDPTHIHDDDSYHEPNLDLGSDQSSVAIPKINLASVIGKLPSMPG
jgi:hypothetical protein